MQHLFCIFAVFCLITSNAVGKAPVHQPAAKNKECPPGFVLKGKTCEALELFEPDYVCPPGTKATDDRCLTAATPKLVCPPGFSLRSGSKVGKEVCFRVELVPVEFYCDEGQLEGKHCKLVIPKSPICSAGYRMEGDRCVRYAPLLKKCPAGFQQFGKECSKKVTFPASPTCQNGFELSSDSRKCYKYEERKAYCPSGFQLSADGQCVKYVAKIRSPCPSGFKSTGSQCETVEKYPVDILCPESFTIDGEKCVKAIAVPSKCPAGYLPSTSMPGLCDRYLPSKPVCPQDTTPAGPGHCQRKIVTEKYPKCPSGFEMIGEKCKKVDEFTKRTICHTGRLQGDQCVTIQSVAPQYACADGYELTKTAKGPQCTQTVQYDCSTTTMKKECEMPEFVNQLVPHERKLKGEYAPRVVAPVISHTSKQPVCRNVKVQVPKTCSKQETIPVSYICPDNGILVGKACQIQAYTEPSFVCTAGDMDAETGRCLKISVSMPTWHCASGSDAGARNCIEFEGVEADFVCPDGTEPELSAASKLKCVEREPEIHFPDKIVTQPAKFACQVGHLSGKTCLKPVVVPAEYVCPDGSYPSQSYGDDLKCVVTAELIQPPPVEVATPPKFICPDGGLAPTKVCYSDEKTPIEEYCPTGTTIDYNDSGKCVATQDLIIPPPLVKSIPALLSCPEGYVLKGSNCSVTEKAEVEKLCPIDHDLSVNEFGKETCLKEHSMMTVCPAGTTQADEGCIKRKHVPPQVTIVRTCTKGQPGCH